MSKVFERVKLAGIPCRNRIVRSATNDYAGNEDGTVSETQLTIYKELTQGEVGLLITGHIAAMLNGRNDIHQNGLWGDHLIVSHKWLTDLVHQLGGSIIAQMNHSGAKAQADAINGEQPVAPSAIQLAPGAPARALTVEEIHEIEDNFASAALRAQQAGYDGIQIHCAHGYLFSQFIDPAWNQREDIYGGSIENRFRIVVETLDKIHKKTGGSFPVLLKVHCNDIEGSDEFQSDFHAMLRLAKAHHVVAAEVSGCDFAARKPEERIYYLEPAARARRETGLPVILVGGVRSLGDMEQALNSGVDLVSMCRPFICQPDIIKRLCMGQTCRCVGCYGCFTCYQKTGKRCVLHRG